MLSRKIKALIDYPDGGSVLKDEIGIIVKEHSSEYTVDFPSQKNYYINKPLDTRKYSLVNDSKLICYKGDGTLETGSKIIKALVSLGGVNRDRLKGTSHDFYYINKFNGIGSMLYIPKGYTLSEIPTTVETPINTYGLHIGMELKKDDIREWPKKGLNYYGKNFGKSWQKSFGTFSNNRTIESFKLINGVVGFLVSNTNGIYLRAEGFLDFINKNKETKEINDYKIGDIVVCLPEPMPNPKDSNASTIGGSGYKSNWCFEIKSIDDYKTYKVIFPKGSGFGVYNNSIRHATKEEKDLYRKMGESYNVTDTAIKEEESLVGRYLKILKNFSHYPIGTYIEIIGGLTWNKCYNTTKFGYLDARRIEDGDVELMPKGFKPPSEILDKQIEDLKPPTKKEYPKIAFEGGSKVLEKLTIPKLEDYGLTLNNSDNGFYNLLQKKEISKTISSKVNYNLLSKPIEKKFKSANSKIKQVKLK